MRFSLRQMLIGLTVWCVVAGMLATGSQEALWVYLIVTVAAVIQAFVMTLVARLSDLEDKEDE